MEFVNEEEADTFYKKIQGRDGLGSKSNGVIGSRKNSGGNTNNNTKRRSKIDKNHIGMPADFRHVGHIGYTAEKGFSIENNDPEWSGIFDQLKELGISADEIQDNQEFIQEFLEQNGTTLPKTPMPPPPQQQRSVASPPPPPTPASSNNMNNSRKKTPPPPPPPGRSRKKLKRLNL